MARSVPMKMAGRARLSGLFLLLGALLLGAGAQQPVQKLEGSEVIMKPIYTGNPSEINWKINGDRLVDMEVNSQVEPLFYRLQDRATIDRTNGVLTIKNLTTGDSGDYKAEALVNNIYQYTDIKLTVQAFVDDPTITDQSTEEKIVLYCNCSTPGVTYEWFNRTESVGKGQWYSEPRPEHDVTRTCVVSNEVSKKSSSITIRYIPPPEKSISGWLVAFIVFLVLVLVALLIVLLIGVCYEFRDHGCMNPIYSFITNENESRVAFFRNVHSHIPCFKGKKTENDDEEKQSGSDKPENEQNTPLITVGAKGEDDADKGHVVYNKVEDSDSCGCISLNLSSKGPVKSVKLLRVAVPSVEAILGELNGQLQRIKSFVLTVDRVKTEDYAAEAHLPNGELRVFTIKGVKGDENNVEKGNGAADSLDENVGVKGEDDAEKGHVVYKKVEEEDDVVIIRTWGDQVTLIVPDAEAVTRLAWKKGDVPQFEWTISGVKLHTNKITLEPGSVTIKNLVPGDSGSYEVDVHSADGSVTKNTFQLEVVKQGKTENVMLKVVRKVDPPEDGDTESQPIGSITFHPIKMTNKTGITWKKEGSPVSYLGDRITPGQNGDLTIKDVTVEDKGTYTVHTEDQQQEFDLRL